MKRQILQTLLVLIFFKANAQNNYQIRHSSPIFGFDTPIPITKPIDTLGMLLYLGESTDSILFFAQLLKNDSSFASQINVGISPADSAQYVPLSDSLKNPLYINRVMFSQMYDSTSELYYSEIAQEDTTMKCSELGMSFFERNDPEKLLFVRVYYNGHDIYTFILIGLRRRETDLNALKDSFFNSIFIN
jgi:hypothetical protein